MGPLTAQVHELRTYAFSAGKHRALLEAAEERRRAVRDELLAPYYDGAYPVRQPHLLVEFYRLDLVSRSLISQLLIGQGSLGATAIQPFINSKHAPRAPGSRRKWPKFVARLVSAGCLALSSEPLTQWQVSADGPFVCVGGKARLLGKYQARELA